MPAAASATPVRDRVHSLLETSHVTDRPGRLIDILLIALIISNVIAVILETVPEVYAPNRVFFDRFEIFSVAVFTVEYLTRIWAAPSGAPGLPPWRARMAYLTSAGAVIDLLAIAPFYLTLFVSIDLRFLRVMRLLRLLKLTRYSSALTMLLDVLRREADSFLAGFFILIVLMIATASGAYLVEHEAQPDAFGSIPHAMWWAVATLTTVGYGDVTPVTAWGKFFGACVTVIGIGMAALPAGILASGLANQLAKRHEALRREYLKALSDGVIDQEEEEELERLRREFGLSAEEAREIREEAFERPQMAPALCPHCGKPVSPDPGHGGEALGG